MTAARVKAWNRSEKWTAAAVMIAALAFIGAFLVPEVRRFFRLEPEPAISAIETRRRDPSPFLNVDPRKLVGTPAHSVDELRKQDGVVRMKDSESGKMLSEIPEGSFGFVDPIDLRHDLNETRLNRRDTEDRFELHKLSDGRVELLTYVGPETVERLRIGVNPGEAVTFFSDTWREAPNLVAVPIGKFRCQRSRWIPLDEGKSKQRRILAAMDCNAD